MKLGGDVYNLLRNDIVSGSIGIIDLDSSHLTEVIAIKLDIFDMLIIVCCLYR